MMNDTDDKSVEDVSIAGSSKSLIRTSTVAKDNSTWSEDKFFKRGIYGRESDSLFVIDSQSPIAVLNEVTNIRQNPENKPVFKLNSTSFISDGANSSLGILHVENFSDLNDSSCGSFCGSKRKNSGKKVQPEKISKLKDSNLQDNFVKVSNERSSSEKPELDVENGNSASSSDIEYDGTNIPELNMDFDVASLIKSNKDYSCDNSQTNEVVKDTSSSFMNTLKSDSKTLSANSSPLYLSKSELVESSSSREQSSYNVRHSIFEDHQPSLNSLYKQLRSKPDQSERCDRDMPKIKVCPFLGVSSFEIEPLPQKKSDSMISTGIENERRSERMSVDFCPEMISARSSSFKSSMAPLRHLSASASHSALQVSQPSHLQPFLEDLENEVLSGSCLLPSKSIATSQLFQNSSSGNEHDTFAVSCDFDQELPTKNGSEFSIEGGNWCSRLGISESDFFNSDDARELLKKDCEEFTKASMLQCNNSAETNASSWSPPSQMEVTAPSWISASEIQDSRHISLGTLIKARSEEVGSMSDEPNRIRPSFGMSVGSNKSCPSSLQNCGLDSTPSNCKTFRPSTLSEILDSVSFADPINFASKNTEIFSSVFEKYNKNKEVALPEASVEDDYCPDSGNQPPSKSSDEVQSVHGNSEFAAEHGAHSAYKQSNDAEDNDKLAEPDKNEPADNSLNVSSVGSACETASVKTAKLEICSECSMAGSEQNAARGYSRSASACSSSFSAVSVQNPCSLQHGCFRHSNSAHDTGQCMVPSNCLIVSSSNPGFMAHVCPQLVLQPGQVCTSNALPGTPFAFGAKSDSAETCIETPSRLCLPEKVAVGDSQEINLRIQNASNSVYSYQVSCISAHLNSLPVSFEMCGVNFVKLVPCTAGSTTDIKLLIAPKFEGKYEIDLQVDAVTNSAGHTFSSLPGMTSKTKVEFEALQPSISLKRMSEGKQNSGCVFSGSTVVEYVTITNNCEVSVPLRISLTSDSEQNQAYFGLKDLNQQNKPNSGRPTFLSPKIMLYRLPGTKSALYPSHLDVPIVFESITSQVTATLSTAIETPTLSIELAFIRVSVSVGSAKLVLKDPSQNPLRLRTSEASTCNHSLTVVNEGTLFVTYDLQIESESSCFSVAPDTLNLGPNQSTTISVTFTPLNALAVKGVLMAASNPHGQVFNITEIHGEVKSHMLCPSFPKVPRIATSQPTRDSFESVHESSDLLECNKKLLVWSGTDIGKSVFKSFGVRNPRSHPVDAKLFMKSKCPAFQVVDDAGVKASAFCISLKPREERDISVAFTPESVSSYSSVLFIKSTVGRESMTNSIPLSGYGGAAKVNVLGIPDGEGLTVDLSSNSEIVYKNVVLQNSGRRAAFVKLFISYSGIVQNPGEKPTVIHPSEFVLLENERKNILLSINCLNKSYNSSDEIVTILYGDEILRQGLRKKKSKSVVSGDFVHNMYNIDFTIPYDGENKVPRDTCVFSASNDAVFYTSIKKLMVPIFFNSQNASFSRHDFTALSIVQDSFANLTMNSSTSSRRLTIEGHSPPVKESAIRNITRLSLPIPFENDFSDDSPADSYISSIVNELNSLKLQSWTLTPEYLVLDAESKDKRIVLKNCSNTDLRFKVECTVDVIAVSPVSGHLAANGEIGLRLSLINSNHSKLLVDYQGVIKVICDGAEKVVNVKVLRDERKMKRLLQQMDCSNQLHLPSQSTMNLSIRSGFLGDSTIAECTVLEQPMPSSLHVNDIHNFPKLIDLPRTIVGCRCDLKLTIVNPRNKTITWNIHPISMLFTEPFDDSVDCSSPAIEFFSSNGMIKPKESIEVILRFVPSSVAQFSQFFELTLIDENGVKENCNFKVQGDGLSDHLPSASNQNNEGQNKKLPLNVRKKAKSEVFLEKETCEFRTVSPGQKSTADIKIKNLSSQDCKLTVIKPSPPFSLKYSSVTVKSQKFLKIPVSFKPIKPSNYEGEIKFLSESGLELKAKLKGCCS